MPTWRFFARDPDGWSPIPDALTGTLADAERRCAELTDALGREVCADSTTEEAAMARLSPKLRSTAGGVAHWCPACRSPHVYTTKPDSRACWSFDGNVERPSFTPSMLIRTEKYVDPSYEDENGESSVCHYFLTAGCLQFCGDSTHGLAGQTVDLPDWPASGDWSAFEDHTTARP